MGGGKCYKVKYGFEWCIEKFPEIKIFDCHGDKCRYSNNLSFNHWCIACYSAPHETNISDVIEIIVKGEQDHDVKMTFGQIIQYIRGMWILNYTEIESPDVLIRTQEMCLQIENRRKLLEDAERKVCDLRNQFDCIHTEFGFESRVDMEDFMHTSHCKAASDLLERTLAKLVKFDTASELKVSEST